MWHVSAIPSLLPGREAVAPTLEVIARELEPFAATFFAVGEDGEIHCSVVHGSHLPPAELAADVQSWKVRLRGLDPLSPAKLAELPGRVATLGSVGGEQRAVLDRAWVRGTYEEIGAINDVRLLIRDGDRLVAGVTLWRRVGAKTWTDSQLRRLASLQPLIEMAYLSAVRVVSSIDAQLPATLTERQRQVARLLATGATTPEIARTLYVSSNTAKSHTRAVLSKLGVSSRREMVMRFAEPAVEQAAKAALGEAAEWTHAEPPTARRSDPVAGEVSMGVDGDPRARQLLAGVLEWATERMGAAMAGGASFSSRSEVVAEASGIARRGVHELDPRLAVPVHRVVLPASQSLEVVRRLDSNPARPLVVRLDVGEPREGDGRLADLVAALGFSAPQLAVLRVQGQIAGVVWLCREHGSPLSDRDSARELSGVHPLLALTQVGRLGAGHGSAVMPAALADCGLTEREMTVARLALTGEGNAAIAGQLGISESTVKKHMTRVLAKCGVRSRSHLIALVGDGAEEG